MPSGSRLHRPSSRRNEQPAGPSPRVAFSIYDAGMHTGACALLLATIQFAVHPALGEQISGRVVGVADGDTITVLDAAKTQHKVRLAGIDALEKAQAFGERSKQNLSALVFGKDVRADCNKRDRYGRDVCRVWVTPSDCRSCGILASCPCKLLLPEALEKVRL